MLNLQWAVPAASLFIFPDDDTLEAVIHETNRKQNRTQGNEGDYAVQGITDIHKEYTRDADRQTDQAQDT